MTNIKQLEKTITELDYRYYEDTQCIELEVSGNYGEQIYNISLDDVIDFDDNNTDYTDKDQVETLMNSFIEAEENSLTLYKI